MIVTSDPSREKLALPAANWPPPSEIEVARLGKDFFISSDNASKSPGIGGTAGLEPVAITKALALRCLRLTLGCWSTNSPLPKNHLDTQ